MFKLGLGLQGYTPSAIAFDLDAAAFFATAGVTDATAKTQINSFVTGVKDLGLWSSMVCWPLRSAQNAGTGTTAYSLGGLGTFNGTLTNGPTWDANGIIFNANNKLISVSSSLGNTIRSGFCCKLSPSNSFNQVLIELTSGVASGSYFILRFNGQTGFGVAGPVLTITRNAINSQNGSDSRSINLTSFECFSGSFGASNDRVCVNGATAISGNRTGLDTYNPTGTITVNQLYGNSTNMTGAFNAIFSVEITENQHSSLYTLYKNTLGAGLGLP
jgi:hypothetical protein